MSLWNEMVVDLKHRPRWQRIGLLTCMAGALTCISVGLLGIVMIEYWHHVTQSWLDDHIFFWMMVGLPSTIAMFAFTRLMGIFH